MSAPSYSTQPAGRTSAPLSAPLYGASFKQAVQRFFAKYTVFSGRASRSEYWWWYLASIIIVAVLYAVFFAGMTPTTTTLSSGETATVPVPGPLSVVAGIVLAVYALAVLIPQLALTVRRLHDGNFSGWMILLGLIPFVGGLIVLVLTLLPSNPQGQRFDEGAGAGYRV
ncbi:DUF805 domain-containing protein [Tersicoccus sp. MR15.9]|uniref:DUF805 domain-containing protein n=1 Tax=Tersicoccus mangrovi TaxID=3121635 RepID=UPI002FE61CAB